MTLFTSLRSLRLHLWDEGIGRLVTFRCARKDRDRSQGQGQHRGSSSGDDAPRS